MLTACTAKSFQNLQLNAGALFVNMELSSITDAETFLTKAKQEIKAGTNCLGGTINGGNFQAVPTMRSIEMDGKRYEFVGSQVIDMWDVKLTGTLKEVTPENVQRVLPTAEIDTVSETHKKITVKTDLAENDYISNVVWAGDTSQGFCVIVLNNALNVVGATLAITDKGEGTLPFEFHAHQADVESTDTAPFEIHFFTNSPAL